MVGDHAVKRGLARPFHWRRPDSASAFAQSQHRLFAYSTTATTMLLVMVFVAFLATEIGLIHFHCARQKVLTMITSLPDALLKEPSCFLCNSQSLASWTLLIPSLAVVIL